MNRHVAVCAVSQDFFPSLWKLSTSLRAMARETPSRNRNRVTLSLMDVMASRATHVGRELITPAELQERDLIPMDIGGRSRAGVVGTKGLVQKFARDIRKGILAGSSQTAMTLRANINLAIAS